MASFLSLPAELRNDIYKYLLKCTEPIDPWSREKGLAVKLLCTNTLIRHEASSLLYGANRFDLTTGSFELIHKFLDTIGLVNASHLECIRIDFPWLRDLEDEVTLEEGSIDALKKIQSHCANLKYLTVAPASTYAMEIQLDSFDSPAICGRTLDLVDTHFRAITTLREIIVEVYEESPSSDIRRKMQSHGWTLKIVESVEEEESDIGWVEIEYYGYL